MFKKFSPLLLGIIGAIITLFIGIITGANFLVYVVFNGEETLFRIVLMVICFLVGFVIYKIARNRINEKDLPII